MPEVPEDSWEAYVRTIVEIVRVGERDLVVRSAPMGQVGVWPWARPGPVHVLTAWDPAGERPGEEENRCRQAALEADLHRLAGAVLWPATGLDPLRGHREEGVAVCGVSTADVARLGGRYRQEAVFVWTPDQWAILACTGGRRVACGWSLGPSVPRPRSHR